MAEFDDSSVGMRRSPDRWPGGRLYFLSPFSSTRAPYRFEMDLPGDSKDDPNYLFSLTEYAEAFGKIFGEGLEKLAEQKSPVLREMVTKSPGERVRTQRVTAPSGKVIDLEPRLTSLPYRFYTHEIVAFDLRALARASDEVAEVLTDANLDHMLSHSGKIAEGLDQDASAGGREFGWPVLLIGLEKVEIDFSPDGEPVLPRFLSENDKRNFFEYPPLTDADRGAFDKLIERKRREFNDRRGSR